MMEWYSPPASPSGPPWQRREWDSEPTDQNRQSSSRDHCLSNGGEHDRSQPGASRLETQALPQPAQGQRKTSLLYILAPAPSPAELLASDSFSSPPAHIRPRSRPEVRRHDRTTSAADVNVSPGKAETPPSLLSLPRSALSLVAYHLVIPPSPADNVESSTLQPQPKPRVLEHPADLLPLIYTCRSVHSSLSFAQNPQLYRDLFAATFDTPALRRRHAWISSVLRRQSGGLRPAYNLFDDPRSWAEDYRARWEMSGRMRRVVRARTFNIDGEGGSATSESGGDGSAEATTVTETATGNGASRKTRTAGETVLADLWNAWFLVTENDGKNVPFLTEYCGFHEWLGVYYRERLLKEAVEPGYPVETGEKALMIWCALLTGTDLIAEQSSAEVDEKIFMLRPYVFACAKYDITYAPWHHRQLPTCAPGCTCTSRASDSALRSKAIPYERFGYTWRRAPPHFVLGAYLVFFRLLERQQARLASGLGSETGVPERSLVSSTFSMPDRPGTASSHSSIPISPSLFSSTRFMPSIFHDREWQRNSVCQDPHTSLGLPPLTFAGELQGFWRGHFLFYDFDQYRGVLSGDMRALYTGAFAAQAVEMELKETVVRVRQADVGGDGPRMSAGYATFDGNEDGPQGLQDDEENPEQRRIREGNGYEVVDPDSYGSDDSPDSEAWTTEILLTGKARTSWGWARARGRVRAWDGLVVISFNYAQHQRHPLGRWLWRGYLHTGGYLIGRWRDTFTPEQLQGYEGAFGMVRAGDIFYPPHHPTRLADSLGLDDNTVKDSLAQTVAAASRSGVDATRGQEGIERNECDGTAAASSAASVPAIPISNESTARSATTEQQTTPTNVGSARGHSATSAAHTESKTAPERIAQSISVDTARPSSADISLASRRASNDHGAQQDPAQQPHAAHGWTSGSRSGSWDSRSGAIWSGSSDGHSSVRVSTPTSVRSDQQTLRVEESSLDHSVSRMAHVAGRTDGGDSNSVNGIGVTGKRARMAEDEDDESGHSVASRRLYWQTRRG